MIIIIVSSDYNNFPHSHIFIYSLVTIFIIIITYRPNYRFTLFMPKKKILSQLMRHTYPLEGW